MVKVAIIGTGRFAKHHISVWRLIREIELVGVHGAHDQRLNSFAAETNLKPYDRLDSLIQNADLVDIVSTHDTHFNYAARALQAGRAVLIEKPLTTTVRDAEKLVSLAKQHGSIGSVVSQMRFSPAFESIRKLISENPTQNFSCIHAFSISPRDDAYFTISNWKTNGQKAGGGVLINQGVHFIDLLLWCLGDPVEIDGNWGGFTENSQGIERRFWGSLLFENGITAQFLFSTEQLAGHYQKMILLGKHESYEVDQFGMSPLNSVSFFQKLRKHFRARFLQNANTNALLQFQFRDVISALSHRTQPAITLEDGLKAVRVIDKLYEVAGRKTPLPNIALPA